MCIYFNSGSLRCFMSLIPFGRFPDRANLCWSTPSIINTSP